MSYCYGPVHSRRLGTSLGIDLSFDKVCSFECIYCQAGPTLKKSIERYSWVDIEALKKEVKKALHDHPQIGYITISGRGEPTLHKNLNKIIKALKDVGPKKRICLITNGTLLSDALVRKEIKACDVIMPSLDAPNQSIFNKINRPLKGLSLKKLIQGLIAFRQEYKKELWLEVMILKGLNDSAAVIKQFKKIIAQIKPDKIFLNQPVRPGFLPMNKFMIGKEKINEIAHELGVISQVIGYKKVRLIKANKKVDESLVLQSLACRPQTLRQLASAFEVSEDKIRKIVRKNINSRKIRKMRRFRHEYYCAKVRL